MLAKEKEETLELDVASFCLLGRVGGVDGGSGTEEVLTEWDGSVGLVV